MKMNIHNNSWHIETSWSLSVGVWYVRECHVMNHQGHPLYLPNLNILMTQYIKQFAYLCKQWLTEFEVSSRFIIKSIV